METAAGAAAGAGADAAMHVQAGAGSDCGQIGRSSEGRRSKGPRRFDGQPYEGQHDPHAVHQQRQPVSQLSEPHHVRKEQFSHVQPL